MPSTRDAGPPPPGRRQPPPGGQPGGQPGRGAAPQPRRRPTDARWEPRPSERPRQPAPARPKPISPGRRNALTGGKTVLGLVSALVLAFTGYYWGVYADTTGGFTTADVIGEGGGGERPADGAVDILLVGMDSRTDAQGKPLPKEKLAELSAGQSDGELNTDTLILVRIPNDGSKAIGVSFPRDSYVEIPPVGNESPGFGRHKINSAYARAKLAGMEKLRKEGVTDQADLEVRSNQVGAKTLIGTLQKLTGVTIDHYAAVNLLGFYDISKAIGGIDVCLNGPVNDRYSGAKFPAGQQILQGAQALAFVRQRHGLPNGDLDRIVRQQVFMSGMAKKVLSSGTLTDSDKRTALADAVRKSVVLDKNWNVIDFATKMQTISGGNVDFRTVPHGRLDLNTSDGDAIEVIPRDVQGFFKSMLGGQQPTSESPPTSSTPPGNAQNAAITVDVRNTTTVDGLANRILTELTNQGFTGGTADTAKSRSKSAIQYAKGDRASAERVAAALGGGFALEQDTSLSKGKVVVLLGKDKATGGGNRLAPEPLLQLNGPAMAAQPNSPGCVN
ncbi:LCP family protein [Herbihabitans rhizosphaerae]|uniref:LCP family protein n=1 Tax=Herbihabitans rhizosphaerae TaxID=1872711 RepID=UPI00102C4B38|nr:LCP family protein [Herbihabitans rhizosphaerae]